MKKIILVVLLSIPYLFAQGQQWIVYRDTNSGLPDNGLVKVKIDKFGNKWILDDMGNLVKFDGITWTVYNYTNSGLPQTGLSSIAIDKKDNKWIGSGKGLIKFDNINWTTYTTSNSCLTTNIILDCDIDSSNNVWLATDSGIIKLDTGSHCTVYNVTNGNLEENYINELKIDSRNWVWAINDPESNPMGYINTFNRSTWQNIQGVPWWPYFVIPEHIYCDSVGNVWGSVGMGILKYDGTTFSVPYDSSITTASLYYISAIYANSALVACGSLAYRCLNYYNGTVWSKYDYTNSPLNAYAIVDIIADRYNNLWIATTNGLYEFNPNGIVLGIQDDASLNSRIISISPNPATNQLTIHTSSFHKAATVSIMNVLGQLTSPPAPLLEERGETSIDVSKLPAGMYFLQLKTESGNAVGRFVKE